MNKTFRINDLVEFLNFLIEHSRKSENVLELTVPYVSNQKVVKQLEKRYPLDIADRFVILSGYTSGTNEYRVNFFKVFGNEIILTISISNPNRIHLHYANGYWGYNIDMDSDYTLNAMFKRIKSFVNDKSISDIVSTTSYCHNMDCLNRFLMRILKIYTRYVKSGKLEGLYVARNNIHVID